MPGGRPSKYKECVTDFELLLNLCRLGLTDSDLAEYYQINRDTIYEWKKKHPEFSDTLKKGRLAGLGNVVAALHKKACGFTHTEEKQKMVGDELVEWTEKQYYPPDTGAAALLLKNRDRTRWKDKWEDGAPEGPQFAPPVVHWHSPAPCKTEGCKGFAHPTAGNDYCNECTKEK